jgi:hypothetical protein
MASTAQNSKSGSRKENHKAPFSYGSSLSSATRPFTSCWFSTLHQKQYGNSTSTGYCFNGLYKMGRGGYIKNSTVTVPVLDIVSMGFTKWAEVAIDKFFLQVL